MSFFVELKRRNVFRVGIAYAVTSWLLIQVTDILFESIGAPPWVMQTMFVALAAGFVIALIFAWAFELTPEGVKKEKDVDRSQSVASRTGKKLNFTIAAMQEQGIGLHAANGLSTIWVKYDRAQLSNPVVLTFLESFGLANYWRNHGNPDYCRVNGKNIECDTQ
jgi:hypothetical protein